MYSKESSAPEILQAIREAEISVIRHSLAQIEGKGEDQIQIFLGILESLSSTEIAASAVFQLQPISDDDILCQLHQHRLAHHAQPRVIADWRRVAVQTLLLSFDDLTPDPILRSKYFLKDAPPPSQQHSHTILQRVEANLRFSRDSQFVQKVAESTDLLDRLEILLNPDDVEFFCRWYQIGPHRNNPYQLPVMERQGLLQLNQFTHKDSSAKLDILENGRAISELAAGIVPGSTTWTFTDGSFKSGYTRTGKKFLRRLEIDIPQALKLLTRLDSPESAHLSPVQFRLLQTVNQVISIGGAQVDGLNMYATQNPEGLNDIQALRESYKTALLRLNHPPKKSNYANFRLVQALEIDSLLAHPNTSRLTPIRRQMLEYFADNLRHNQPLKDIVYSYNQSRGTRYSLSGYYRALYDARELSLTTHTPQKPQKHTPPPSAPKPATNEPTKTEIKRQIDAILARAKARSQSNK